MGQEHQQVHEGREFWQEGDGWVTQTGQYIPWHTALHMKGGALAGAWDKSISNFVEVGV